MTAPSIDAVSGLVEELRARAHAADDECRAVDAIAMTSAAEALEVQARELAVKDALIDRLRLEAQIHSGEARAHKATVHEAYQACTGATGEPGNWHGAQPIKQALATAEARIAALESDAREKDEARTALATRLGGYAITEEYDFPGDAPEFCGFWCNECREHVEADGAGHQKACLCHGVAPMTPRAKQSRSALSKGEPQ